MNTNAKNGNTVDTAAVRQKPKSKIALYWEKYPNGIGYKIADMNAVLQ